MVEKDLLTKMDKKIQAIKKAALELKELSGGIQAVDRNADRILTSTKMLEITVKDYSENEVTYEIKLEIQNKGPIGEKQPSFVPGFEVDISIFSLIIIIFYILFINQKKQKFN